MKVSFVCKSAVAIYYPEVEIVFGGAETRAVTLATALAKQAGFEIELLVRDCGQARAAEFDGVSVLVLPNAFDRAETRLRAATTRLPRFPYWRFKRWDWRLLRAAPWLAWQYGLKRCGLRIRQKFDALGPDVDVACTFGVNALSADLIRVCRRRGIRSVLFVASDHNVDRSYDEYARYVSRSGEDQASCDYALQHADHILVQTKRQQELLKDNFGLDADVVRNPIDVNIGIPTSATAKTEDVLWVGRADTIQKRPDLCLQVARSCPKIPFTMIMNRREPGVFERIVADAPQNVRVVERVPFEQMDDYFRNAKLLLSTSVLEGFPNVFLQAAKYSLPIFSLSIDPDGFVGETGAGVVAGGDVGLLAARLRESWEDARALAAMGNAARRYVVERHDVNAVVTQLVTVFKELTDVDAPGPGRMVVESPLESVIDGRFMSSLRDSP